MEEQHYCNNCKRHISTANFATHSVHCERNYKVCTLCEEPIQISHEEEHLEKFHTTVPCDLCKIPVEKWMLPKHQESCTKRPIACNYCEGEIPFEKFSEHFEFCSSRTEKCMVCEKYVMLKDKQKHSEIHSCEKNIRHVNIDNEVKQNIINEVISTSSSGQSTQEKVDETKSYSVDLDSVMASKEEAHLKIKIPRGVSACALDTPNEMSKRYTTCHICRQIIPWIDFNTHIPSCASDAGKCSRCGEDVPNHEFKEHILKNCRLLAKGSSGSKTDLKRDKVSGNETFYVAENNADDQNFVECMYCGQACSSDRIVEHLKNCSENCFECPLCSVKVHEKDKFKHESFDCTALMEIDMQDVLYPHSSLNASRNSHEKHKASSDINMTSKGTITKEKSYTSHNIDKSYADAARKLSSPGKDSVKHSSECKPCCPCKKSQHKMQEHSYNSRNNEKKACFYCLEEIDVMREDIHLDICKAFRGVQKSRSEPEYRSDCKGAVPKNSKFANMVKPLMTNCKFCKTTLNADIIYYHEKECVHQPIPCEQCNDNFPLKDLGKHTCRNKRGKRGKKEKEKEKTESDSGFGDMVRGWFNKSENRDGCDSTRVHSGYSDPFAYNYSVDVYTDVKIPCEFCGELYSASEIVLHETGCEPDLVSLPKKDSQEDRETKGLISPGQINTLQHDSISEKKFFPFENKTNLLANRSGGIKKCMESDVKPGEFLESVYDIKTSEISKHHQTESANYSSNSSIQSVWNFNSSNTQTEAAGLKILPHTSFSGEAQESEKISETQKQFHDDKEIFNSDDELSEMLDFINEDKTNAADKEVSHAKYEEFCEKYSKGIASHMTSDQNPHSQRHDEDIQETKNLLEFADPTSRLGKEPTKNFSESGTFDLKRLERLPNTVSEIKGEKRAFTIEPVENHHSTYIRKIGEEIDYHVKNNQDVKMQRTSKENYSTPEDDLEKWQKWQSKKSSSN